MTEVHTSQKLPFSADQVWDMIGRFGSVANWHPAVVRSEEREEDGATVRELSLLDGSKVLERLEKLDDGARSCTYSIVSSPFPVANYSATLSVRAEDENSCTVEWAGSFEAAGASEDEATKVVRQIYETGFENLRKMFGT